MDDEMSSPVTSDLDFRHDVWRAFGEELRRCREARGMSQYELADKLASFGPGGSQSAIAKMEAGTRLTSVDQLVALAWILRVDADRLLPRLAEPSGRHVDAARLREEAESLEAQLQQLQLQWDQVQLKLTSLEPQDRKIRIYIPEGILQHRQHPEEA